MLLSRQAILRAIDAGDIVISPFDNAQLKPASYTLRLGGRVALFDIDSTITISSKFDHAWQELSQDGFVLSPGEFVVGETLEDLTLSEVVAGLLSVRGSCAQLGLNALNSDLAVEPGSRGRLKLAIKNVNRVPIRIYPGMNIIKVLFFSVE